MKLLSSSSSNIKQSISIYIYKKRKKKKKKCLKGKGGVDRLKRVKGHEQRNMS
jgi:hypothetical protein